MSTAIPNLERYWNGNERDEYSDRPDVLFEADALPFLAPCRKVIDLGSGVGNLVERWTAEGKDAIGVTYQEREVAVAQERGRNVIQGDIHSLPFDDGEFDGFNCWDCLEHTVSPYIALCEARRITRPGGRGIIFIPGAKWIETPYHIIVPTIRQMQHLLRLSGWHLEALWDLSTSRDDPEGDAGMAIYFLINP